MAVDRFQRLLAARGLDDRVRHLSDNTRTAELAAAALGTPVGAIVKSLVVLVDDRPVLALVSGDRRADLTALAQHFGADRATMARADRVKQITGFAIGGIPPFAPDADGQPLRTVIDPELFRFQTVWAAAGSPYAVFPIDPSELAAAAAADQLAFTHAIDGAASA